MAFCTRASVAAPGLEREVLVGHARAFLASREDGLGDVPDEARWRAALGGVIARELAGNGESDLLPAVAPLGMPEERSGLSLEQIIDAYPAALGGETRKSCGAYYTPTALARRIAELAVPQGGSPRVLDPACGAGSLLIAATERLAVGLTREESLQLLFGVDTDPVAVLLCRAALRDWAGLPASTPLPNIRLGDALDLTGEFDAIVGNPPFGNVIEGLVPERFKKARLERYPELGGTADLAYYFTALSTRLLSSGGRAALLQPRSFVSTGSTQGLRTSVHGVRLVQVEQAESHDLFDGAAVFVCIAVFERRGSDHAVTVAMPIAESPFEISASMTVAEAYAIQPLLKNGIQGSRLLTSGLIDPGQSLWGTRKCRYLGSDYSRPVLRDNSRLPRSVRARLERARRPKIIVAGLSSRIESYLDAEGHYLGAVSTYTITHPTDALESLLKLQEWLASSEATGRFRDALGPTALGGGNITLTKSFLKTLVSEIEG